VVRRYYGFRETTGSPIRRREGPGADVVVVLSFGPEWRIGAATDPARRLTRHTSFVGGLRETAVFTEHDGRSDGMQISLTPAGAFALFGLPMAELAGRIVDLESILGTRAGLMVEALAETRDWGARFAALDLALASRLPPRRAPAPELLWAWRRLVATHGRVPMGELAGELGWSRKRIVANFREQIGLPPKKVARVLRFEHARTLAERGSVRGMADVALEAGYYDQAHLSGEARRITGAPFSDLVPH
jgi:AraC-like DNA-binding protein